MQPPDVLQTLLLNEYINTFDEKQHKAYEIAKECLKSSFDITKSNGYLNFIKQRVI